ncbi:HAD family hydrolase [Labilibaculum euxinus]|uniref:HAD-IA family hydrolase n=1 Tax=Labilibaculum euxinus TaxID=2686357 RepID=A0A7M4DBR6_9BACT|nr:HAD family phosphatase [Labilibaculum euxinus]MUP40095.1 HAD-IA family hydrolase [Labilibaculum euxinus]MVB09300.1 HAD-IA family hydrolase [Labilibaculum euxinus]
MQKYNSIPNIVFDFGGVLLNINTDQAVKSFKEIGLTDIDVVKKEYQTNGLFDRLEKGIINADQFRLEIREHIIGKVTDEQIDAAWNSMLLDLPYERLEMLEKLKKNHRIFLLSNTNIIHWEAYMGMIKNLHGVCLSDFFENDYYSHNMGLRKPDPQIYTTLLKKEGLIASETLFIDDMMVNTDAAKSVGMKAHYLNLEKGETILDLF